MTTNVTPGYKDAEARYKAATTDEERLAALEDMASTLNKHKGTEKLYADIKRRIKLLRESEDKQAAKRGFSYKVEREGAAQVVLVGVPNAGKSSVLAAVTRATPEIADYPFTTRAPGPGMMMHEDVALQLVDLPPVSAEFTESWVYEIARTADLVALVFDVTAPDPTADITAARDLLLEHAKVPLLRRDEAPPADARLAAKPAVLVGTRLDVPGAAEMLDLVREALPGFPIVGLGRGESGAALAAELPRAVYERLDLVRVYSKPPGKDAALGKPFVLKRGATLMDFAARVHKDFAEKLAFARIWGAGKFEGQRVQRDHVLEEKDVIELHL